MRYSHLISAYNPFIDNLTRVIVNIINYSIDLTSAPDASLPVMSNNAYPSDNGFEIMSSIIATICA